MLLQGNAYISGAASGNQQHPFMSCDANQYLQNKGIGRATAFAFAEHGIESLAISDRNEGALEEVRQELEKKHPGVNVTCYTVDVSNEASIVETLGRVFKSLGHVNYSINNAGVGGLHKGSIDLETKEFLQVLDVNLTGLWISEREQLKYMLKQEPREEKSAVSSMWYSKED
jgi:NAD(P)-dependent dehydrogenase (short-subunit alcohol dehydrogenase family)